MRRLALLALSLGCAGAALGGTRVTSADLAQIRAVIHREIDAFGSCTRSAPGAAATAPAAVSFLDLTVMGGADVVQQVRVTDHAGSVWVAYYALQRLKQGGWRTSGCHLLPSARTVSAAYQPR